MGILAELYVNIKADFKDFDKAVKDKLRGTSKTNKSIPVGDNKDTTKTKKESSTSDALLGGLMGGTAGGIIGSTLKGSLGKPLETMAGALGFLVGLPLGPFLAQGTKFIATFGVKMAKAIIRESRLAEAGRTSLKESLSSAGDMVLFGVLTLYNWLKDKIGPYMGDLKSIVLDPDGWVIDKLSMASIFATDTISQWWNDKVSPLMKAVLTTNPINIGVLFMVGREELSGLWSDIKSTLKDIIYGDKFNLTRSMFVLPSINLNEVFNTDDNWTMFLRDRSTEIWSEFANLVQISDLFGGPKMDINNFFTNRNVKIGLDVNSPFVTFMKDVMEFFSRIGTETKNKEGEWIDNIVDFFSDLATGSWF